MHTHMCIVYIHICVFAHIYMLVHIYILKYIHIYKQTYILLYSNTHINAIIIYTHAYSHTLPGNLDICSYTAYAHVQMTTCNCIYEHISRYVDIHQCVQSRYKEIQHAII